MAQGLCCGCSRGLSSAVERIMKALEWERRCGRWKKSSEVGSTLSSFASLLPQLTRSGRSC
jgi:hypothetical protein